MVKGYKMDPQKVTAILDWPAPTDKKGVQCFIRFANFYQKFIRGFSAIIAPITELVKQGTRFLWSPKAQATFDPALPFVLEVDASEIAVGAVLSQQQGAKALLYLVDFFPTNYQQRKEIMMWKIVSFWPLRPLWKNGVTHLKVLHITFWSIQTIRT